MNLYETRKVYFGDMGILNSDVEHQNLKREVKYYNVCRNQRPVVEKDRTVIKDPLQVTELTMMTLQTTPRTCVCTCA